MNAIHKILLLLDRQQPAAELLAKVVLLAKKYGAKVELFECCYSRPLVSSYLFDPANAERARHSYLRGEERRLQLVADKLTEAGVEVATDVLWEVDTGQGIQLKIERFRPDLVIKGCRYHHRLAAFLFGNLDWQLIRHVTVPLLLIRPQLWRASPVVVTALDPFHDRLHPAQLDDLVLRAGESLVEHVGGVLHLFNSYHELPSSVVFDDTVMLNYEDLRDRLAEQHRQGMAELLQGHGLGLAEPIVHLAHGEVHKELPAYARDISADVVVMGGVERNATDRLFIGSTTEKVLDHLEADVLVVRAGN